MEIGEDGVPQGVSGLRVATWVKPWRDWRPVPPMTAIDIGSNQQCLVSREAFACEKLFRLRTFVVVCDVGHLAKADVYLSRTASVEMC